MRTKLSVIIAALAALMLTGCAHRPVYVPVGPDPSMVHLNKIAEKAEGSTHVLAEIQMAQADSNITMRGAKNARITMTATPKGWGKRTSLNYQGPFNKLFYRLALKANYQYFEQGTRPANVPLVTIMAQHKTLKQILDDAVAQLPGFISIAVYPRTRSFIVNYNQGR